MIDQAFITVNKKLRHDASLRQALRERENARDHRRREIHFLHGASVSGEHERRQRFVGASRPQVASIHRRCGLYRASIAAADAEITGLPLARAF